MSEAAKEELIDTFLNYVKNDVEQLKKAMNFMTEENADLRKKVELMEKKQRLSEGLITRLMMQVNQQQETIIDLQCRSMRDNIVINGIREDDDEKWHQTKEKVAKFLKDDLRIHDELPLDRVHRMGHGPKPRPIVAKFLTSDAKSLVFQNVKNLAGKVNLSISEQFPPEIQQRRKELWPLYKQAKQNQVKNVKWNVDKLIINGSVHTANQENLDVDFDEDVKDVDITHTELYSEGGSTFIGHAAEISSARDVSVVMAALLQDKALVSATHHFYAYRVGRTANQKEAYHDDREHGGGQCLRDWLREEGKTNTVVIVSRWFGGRHLGPRRFNIFKEMAKQACDKLHNSR
jgi:hypothetical protein